MRKRWTWNGRRSSHPGANIDVIECNNDQSLYSGVACDNTLPGVSVVSMSWGNNESSDELALDSYFSHPGVTYVSGPSDGGTDSYPAFSPNVVGAGGTSLFLDDASSSNTDIGYLNADSSYKSEVGWSSSSGGMSQFEGEPAYQLGVQNTGKRTIPDVALDADPLTGVVVSNTYDNPDAVPWDVGSGTSLATPCWAGLIALVNQGRAAAGKPLLNSSSPTETLEAPYSLPSTDFHNNLGGTNGTNANNLLDPARYDEVTGLGTPKANLLVPDLINYVAPLSAPSSTSLNSTPDPSIFGQMVEFTATISTTASGLPAPTGSVEFFDGSTELGTAGLNSAGVAVFGTAALPAGMQAITAEYLGDDNFSASTSAASAQTVAQGRTTTSVIPSVSTPVQGQAVTITATVGVVAPGAGEPTGTVNFLDGSISLGSAPLDDTGTAVLTTSALAVGSHSITAVYQGDANFAGSTSGALALVGESRAHPHLHRRRLTQPTKYSGVGYQRQLQRADQHRQPDARRPEPDRRRRAQPHHGSRLPDPHLGRHLRNRRPVRADPGRGGVHLDHQRRRPPGPVRQFR